MKMVWEAHLQTVEEKVSKTSLNTRVDLKNQHSENEFRDETRNFVVYAGLQFD